MIYGIGTDLINSERVEKLLNRFGEKFLFKVFSNEEIDNSKNMPHFILKPPLVNTEQKKYKNRRCIDIFTLLNIYTTK